MHAVGSVAITIGLQGYFLTHFFTGSCCQTWLLVGKPKPYQPRTPRRLIGLVDLVERQDLLTFFRHGGSAFAVLLAVRGIRFVFGSLCEIATALEQ